MHRVSDKVRNTFGSGEKKHHHENRAFEDKNYMTPGGTMGTECGPTCAPGVGMGTQAKETHTECETSNLKESGKVTRHGEEAVCGQEHYTKVEDRPRVIERKEYIKEHHPVEKEFLVETRFVGEKELQEGRDVEVLGTQEREIKTTAPKSPCE